MEPEKQAEKRNRQWAFDLLRGAWLMNQRKAVIGYLRWCYMYNHKDAVAIAEYLFTIGDNKRLWKELENTMHANRCKVMEKRENMWLAMVEKQQ